MYLQNLFANQSDHRQKELNMSVKPLVAKNVISMAAAIAMISIANNAQAQDRAPVQIGGPNGIVMGGGMGFKIGGRNGIHFGGGQGAKFGPREFGMHFGNGQGARFGGQNLGMQFGGGQGARFGTPEFGMQFGHGEGARFGHKERPLMKFGGRDAGAGRQAPEGTNELPQIPTPALEPRPTTVVPAETGIERKNADGTFSILIKD